MSKLEIKRDNGKIFCPLTNSWHIETPEVKVRQEYTEFVVPLPPLAEQKRIVEKLE